MEKSEGNLLIKLRCILMTGKAAFLLLAVALQKSSPKSKTKDHQEVLCKRLHSGRKGKLASCYVKVEFFSDVLESLRQISKVFAKLVLKGPINSMLRFLSETSTWLCWNGSFVGHDHVRVTNLVFTIHRIHKW